MWLLKVTCKDFTEKEPSGGCRVPVMRGTSTDQLWPRLPLGAWSAVLRVPHAGAGAQQPVEKLLSAALGGWVDVRIVPLVENLHIVYFPGVKLQPLSLENCFKKASLRFKPSLKAFPFLGNNKTVEKHNKLQALPPAGLGASTLPPPGIALPLPSNALRKLKIVGAPHPWGNYLILCS